MPNISELAAKWGRTAYWLARFAKRGRHPRRGALVRAYLRLHFKIAMSSIVRRPVRTFFLLGTEMHFSEAHRFSHLLMEIFIQETYREFDPSPVTIVDLGSNIGMSILFFKSLWPNSRILGVEASPEIFAYLEENVRGLPDVSVVNRAVSDHAGQITFYSTSDSLMGSTNPLRGGGTGTVVETMPMSGFIAGPVDLLKIDVEGSEMAAFAELEASNKLTLIERMLIEYHHHLPSENHSLAAFLERLERSGFRYELGALMPEVRNDMQDILIRAWRD